MTSLSVIIPAYNSADFLGATLTAILGQSTPPSEVIVVDDGSTDETQDIAASFGSPVRCYRVENGGQGKARAFAIGHTTCEWVALCDSDDIWNENHLERRWMLIDCYPDADFSYSDFRSFGPNADPNHTLLQEAPAEWLEQWVNIDEHNFYPLKQPYPAILRFNPAYPSGMVFRRSTYLKMGGFREKYSRWIAEDSEFTRRFSSLADVTFIGDSQQTWNYRRHPSNYSLIQWRNFEAKATILQEHLDLGVVPVEFLQLTQNELERSRSLAFDQAFWGKAYDDANRMYHLLPRHSRSIKRRLRYMIARLKSKAA
ncbi:MAG: glycosyltransferase family 2 protein [Gammaproteobacteria bacterium]|nr:glycosyltransferase family 2 protein [Gammaproteobacteria bacterium]MDH3768683.1 glycosyltransferase family 2 protein [Gammaproteobacteria bacterium]